MSAESRLEMAEAGIQKSSDDARAPRFPEPSSDPNDPLNWLPWEKLTTYIAICLFSFIANINGSNFTVAIVALEKEFHTTSTRATFLVGFNVLMFGLGNILWVPLMRVLGKRPVYLLALSLFVAANAWSARATSWGSLLGGRMVSGFGASAADATVPSVVSDMFFADERGHRMMSFHFALASGIFLGPLINAWIVQLHGWRWSCDFLAIAGGVVLVLAFFFIRETQFYGDRQDSARLVPDRRPWYGWWSVSIGYNNDRPMQRFLRTFWDILRMSVYPPVFWVGCLVGLFVGWTIVIQVTASQLFLKPPYSWHLGDVGIFSIAGWLGIVLSFYFGGRLIDFIAYRGRNHNDMPEPQRRLPALLIPTLLAPVGLIIYGECMAHKTVWVGQAFGYAMHSFGFTAVSNIAVTYAVDCYQAFSGEALVTVFVIRNVIAVVCSFYSNVWIQQDGVSAVFGTMAGLEWALMAVAIPVYVFSSQILAFTDKYGPQKRLRERRG
ncbi:polyamine transporter [Teratosphaeria nubilosa]|uniref:Polyamine transporter n=1 Tax=Teratosphaeria nubilosa TaxID=161662 RepID=A0A6G1KX36_9PEZI|nr:polyamine transporter [Teratosphaeria nubilosa]